MTSFILIQKHQHLALVSLAVACQDVVVVEKETSDRFETDWSNRCDHAAATEDGHHTNSNAGESPPRHLKVSRHSSSKQVFLRASFEKPHIGRVDIKQLWQRATSTRECRYPFPKAILFAHKERRPTDEDKSPIFVPFLVVRFH